MAPISEEKHNVESLIIYMHECASIHMTYRKKISRSKEFRDFLFSMANDGSSEMISLLKESLDRCSSASARAAKDAKDKKRHETLQADLRPVKRHKVGLDVLKTPPKLLFGNARGTPEAHKPRDTAMANVYPSRATPSPLTKQLERFVQPNSPLVTTTLPSAYKDNGSETESLDEDQQFLTREEDTRRPAYDDQDQQNTHSPVQIQRGTEPTAMDPVPRRPYTVPTSAQEQHPPILNGSSKTPGYTLARSDRTTSSHDGVDAAGSDIDSDEDDIALDVSSNAVIPASRTAFETEVGIVRGDPKVLHPLKAHCLTLSTSQHQASQYQESDIDSILETCKKFDFTPVKHALLSFFSDRRANAASTTMSIPSTWDMGNPTDIISAIEVIGINSHHAKIHRAYAQAKLYSMVQEQVNSRAPVTTTTTDNAHGRRAPHLVILNGMAAAESTGAPTSEQEKLQIQETFHNLESAYRAGKHWLQVAEWFGGEGIIFVFILRSKLCKRSLATPWQRRRLGD